jgi:hypothetical protein
MNTVKPVTNVVPSTMNTTPSTLSIIPPELVDLILESLATRDLLPMRLVNEAYNNLANRALPRLFPDLNLQSWKLIVQAGPCFPAMPRAGPFGAKKSVVDNQIILKEHPKSVDYAVLKAPISEVLPLIGHVKTLRFSPAVYRA